MVGVVWDVLVSVKVARIIYQGRDAGRNLRGQRIFMEYIVVPKPKSTVTATVHWPFYSAEQASLMCFL